MTTTILGFIRFQLCESDLAISLGQVREVLPMVELVKPPRLPSLIEGLLALGAELYPVVRLDRILGLGEQRVSVDSHLLLIKAKQPYVLLVDRVSEVFHVAQQELLSVQGPQTFNGCVTAQIRIDQIAVLVLSTERLLLEQESKVISEFANVSQKRTLGAIKVAG